MKKEALYDVTGLNDRWAAKEERRVLRAVAEIEDIVDENFAKVMKCGRDYQCGLEGCPVCCERFGKQLVSSIQKARIFTRFTTAVSILDEDGDLMLGNLLNERLHSHTAYARMLIEGSGFKDASVLGVVHGRTNTADQRNQSPPRRSFLLINSPLDDNLELAVNSAMAGSGRRNFLVEEIDVIETLRRIACFFKSPFDHSDAMAIENAIALAAYGVGDRLVLHNLDLSRDAKSGRLIARARRD